MERFIIDDGLIQDTWSRLEFSLFPISDGYEEYKYKPGFFPIFETDGNEAVTLNLDYEEPAGGWKEATFKKKLLPLLLALKELHDNDIVYGSLTPNDVYDTEQGLFLNRLGEGKTVSEKNPYMAIEYFGMKELGNTASDIYALCMMIYEWATGFVLPSCKDREIESDYEPLSAFGYSESFANAIDKGLSIYAVDRYQNASEMLGALYTDKEIEDYKTDWEIFTRPYRTAEEEHTENEEAEEIKETLIDDDEEDDDLILPIYQRKAFKLGVLIVGLFAIGIVTARYLLMNDGGTGPILYEGYELAVDTHNPYPDASQAVSAGAVSGSAVSGGAVSGAAVETPSPTPTPTPKPTTKPKPTKKPKKTKKPKATTRPTKTQVSRRTPTPRRTSRPGGGSGGGVHEDPDYNI